MLNYKLKIGLLPIRRYIKEPPKRIGIFQSDYAVENKVKCVKYIKDNFTDDLTDFIDIDFLNEEGLLYIDNDCGKVIDYFKEQKINALFIINCNFGNENAAGNVAKALNIPTLLWGPRDRNFSNGLRYTDTQCGLFSMSKQLKRNNIKFSYIENCDIENDVFKKGLEQFFSVATMVNNFKNLEIVQIGSRVKPFKSVMCNELELCEKFGISINPVNLAEVKTEVDNICLQKDKQLEQDLTEFKKTWDTGGADDQTVKKMLALVYFFENISKQYGSNIITCECWTGILPITGANPCLAMSILADKGVYVICESDIHMAITNALLSCAARGKKIPLQGEFTTRHPDDDNAELLWHCGPFPLSCKCPCAKAKLYNTKPSFKVKDGNYTVARFQVEKGKYYLLAMPCETTKGPETFGTYMWAKFEDLAKVERKLIEGPYIHHVSEIEGDYVNVLKEFTQYIDDIVFDTI